MARSPLSWWWIRPTRSHEQQQHARRIHMTQTRGNIVLSNRWQDWLNLLLGAWLFISPWVLGFAQTQAAAGAGATHSLAAPNAWIFGVIVVLLSIAALARTQPWEEWLNLIAGIWLFISPW